MCACLRIITPRSPEGAGHKRWGLSTILVSMLFRFPAFLSHRLALPGPSMDKPHLADRPAQLDNVLRLGTELRQGWSRSLGLNCGQCCSLNTGGKASACGDLQVFSEAAVPQWASRTPSADRISVSIWFLSGTPRCPAEVKRAAWPLTTLMANSGIQT